MGGRKGLLCCLTLGLSKTVVCLMNMIFLFVGAFLIMFGTFSIDLDKNSISGFFVNTSNIGYGTILIGCTLLIIALIGCCGSYSENRFIMFIYTSVIFLILALILSIGLIATVTSLNINGVINSSWDRLDNNTRFFIENNFNCCGIVSPVNTSLCHNFVEVGQNITGCYDAIVNYLEEKLMLIQLGNYLFSIIFMIGLIFSCCLLCAIPTKKEKKKKKREEDFWKVQESFHIKKFSHKKLQKKINRVLLG